MFHRATTISNNNKATQRANEANNQSSPEIKAQATKIIEKKLYQSRVESSAVERYAKSEGEPAHLANENLGGPHNIPTPEETNSNLTNTNINHEYEKEVQSMNNPETPTPNEDKKPTIVQNRDVNIPGNNFQRPGAQPAAARPAYPGSYAANNTAANNPYAPQGNTESNGRKLVIGQGITMSGEIESCEHLIVEGTIEATLKGASVLDVYESGAFLGTVEIDSANIAGRFEGDITVKGRLTIESTGQVIGSISYKELSMEAGAVIDGSISPIGSTNAAKMPNKKNTNAKVKKASSNDGAELPFADNKAQAAE